MKPDREPVQVYTAMGTDFYDDHIVNEKAAWPKEATPSLMSSIRVTSGRQWVCPVVTSVLLLALIISVAVSNQNTDERISSIDQKLSNLSSAVTTVTKSLQNAQTAVVKADLDIQRLQFALDSSQNQLNTATESLAALKEMDQLKLTMAGLKCSLNKLLNNGTAAGCCPLGWTPFSGRCYLFSEDGLSWPDAQSYCVTQGAWLVTMKTQEEWDWVSSRTGNTYFWVGLSDSKGPWEWVDGTPYRVERRQWIPGQPDNWTGHGLGGTEDCAHFHSNGRLNDFHCSHHYRFICQGGMLPS